MSIRVASAGVAAMKMQAQCTLADYARQFWERQRGKKDPRDDAALKAISAGADPVVWLRNSHSYKLPRPENANVAVVVLTEASEVHDLLVHDYLPTDSWMRDRGIVPEPFTRRLGDLAGMGLRRGYFCSSRPDRQVEYFKRWAEAGSMANVLPADSRPLIEAVGEHGYEIVDGWGRLLPFAALISSGVPFAPFEVFLASPPETKGPPK
jgi:hypothetical protein